MNNITTTFTKTTDPNTIQEWAEVRGGTPARDMNDETKLEIIFDENKEAISNLQKISWEEFFELFKENNYCFGYQPENEEVGEGELNREYKIEKNEPGQEDDETGL